MKIVEGTFQTAKQKIILENLNSGRKQLFDDVCFVKRGRSVIGEIQLERGFLCSMFSIYLNQMIVVLVKVVNPIL